MIHLITALISGIIGFVAGGETHEWLSGKMEAINKWTEERDKREDDRVEKQLAQMFGIKPGVDWSEDRVRDFRAKVFAKLSFDRDFNRICESIQTQVRIDQEKLD